MAHMEEKKENKEAVCFQIKGIFAAVVSKLKSVSSIFIVNMFIIQ